jgi:hypothetical protein
MAEIPCAFEQAVLLGIFRLGGDACGRAILKEVPARLGLGTPVRDGHARRFYRLEPAGLEALNDARSAVNNLWRGLKWPLKGFECLMG